MIAALSRADLLSRRCLAGVFQTEAGLPDHGSLVVPVSGPSTRQAPKQNSMEFSGVDVNAAAAIPGSSIPQAS